MRIGLIAPPWLPTPPPAYGGTEQVVDTLARGLVAAGHDVLLFTTGDATCPVRRRWVFETPPTPMTGTVPETYHLVSAYRSMTGVDIIHDHTTLGPLLTGLGPDVPVVATNHGPFNAQSRAIYAAANDRIDLIAISRAQAATAGAGIDIAAVIHHGLDVDNVPVGTGAGGYVLFLGRMAEEKGVHIAIEAAQRAGMPIKLAAKCREEREHEYFDTYIRPRLGQDVEFVGEVGGDEKFRLLGNAAALVNPIQWPEPFGLVMAEALACGTPVIATPYGAAPEIVREGTGALCSTTAEVAEAIRDVGRFDRALCREAAERNFSAARMVEQHVELYTTLLARDVGDREAELLGSASG